MFFEWILNFFLSLFYFAAGLVTCLWKYAELPGAPADKKLHLWMCLGITSLGFVILHFLFGWAAVKSWLIAVIGAAILAVVKELVYDFWIRGKIADFEDILAGVRGIVQASIWAWIYMVIRDI